MATVIGQAEQVYKRFTCYKCGAIVQYVPSEVRWNGQTDEGTKIMGLNCPQCWNFVRTNP